MKPRTIRIQTELNGWIVEVGCKVVVFDNLQNMADMLVDYMTNPEVVEKAFMDNAVYEVTEAQNVGIGFSPITGSVQQALNDEE